MTKLYGNAKLVKDMRIDVDDGKSHAICLDLAPPDGTNLGPSALEVAVMSNAGCYATIFALTARAMRLSLEDLYVKTEAVKSEDVGTISEVSFDITVKSDAPEDRIKRAHELTVKNCPVGKLFEKARVKTTYSLRVEKA